MRRPDDVTPLTAAPEEIEDATFARVSSLPSTPLRTGPEYEPGLRVAVATAVETSIAIIERKSGRAAPVPLPLLGQACLAARSGVGLDVVARRYAAAPP
jgi:hypothetical protein